MIIWKLQLDPARLSASRKLQVPGNMQIEIAMKMNEKKSHKDSLREEMIKSIITIPPAALPTATPAAPPGV